MGFLAQALPGAGLIRAMPNTPALLGEGMTALSLGPRVSPVEAKRVELIFTSVGKVAMVEEPLMDADDARFRL